MQKNGAGLHTASSCFWDNQTDGERRPLSASERPSPALLDFKALRAAPRHPPSGASETDERSESGFGGELVFEI